MKTPSVKQNSIVGFIHNPTLGPKRFKVLDIIHTPKNDITSVYVFDTLIESIIISEWWKSRKPTLEEIKNELVKYEDGQPNMFYIVPKFVTEYQTYADKIRTVLQNGAPA